MTRSDAGHDHSSFKKWTFARTSWVGEKAYKIKKAQAGLIRDTKGFANLFCWEQLFYVAVFVVEYVGHDEVQERHELDQIVLQRRTSE